MLQYMSYGNDSDQMRLRYTLDQVSEKDENRLRPERLAFYQNFGFYRNLHEDEEARTRLNFSLQLPFTKVRMSQTCLLFHHLCLSPSPQLPPPVSFGKRAYVMLVYMYVLCGVFICVCVGPRICVLDSFTL